MMLQSEENALLALMGRPAAPESAVDFRRVNDALSEMTNLMWGSFKNRYIGDGKPPAVNNVQIPIVVNHKHKYISFGTENPQLCFMITLTEAGTGRASNLYVRFIFNLNWSPEDFKEITHDAAELVSSGELELF
jgi:hypothetical protein